MIAPLLQGIKRNVKACLVPARKKHLAGGICYYLRARKVHLNHDHLPFSTSFPPHMHLPANNSWHVLTC